MIAALVLAASGAAGVHTYRIPALTVTTRGTLIATYDERMRSSSDLPNTIHIAERRSSDGGKTWSAQRTIVSFPQGGTGDSSLLTDRRTGRIFLFYGYGPPGIGFFQSRAGSNSANDAHTMHAEVQWSDDDGVTWSAPRDLNPEIKDPSWRGLFASSGRGVQLQNGRLLQPYVVMDAKGVTHAADAYSDDDGRTWRMGSFAGSDVNESKALQLPGGEVLQNVRHNDGGTRYLTLSKDGAQSFGAMQADPQLIDPGVNADEIADGDALFFVNAADARARRNLTLRASCDGGKTWPARQLLQAGPAAYAVMARLPDGMLGVLYEAGMKTPYEKIEFARVDPADLLGEACVHVVPQPVSVQASVQRYELPRSVSIDAGGDTGTAPSFLRAFLQQRGVAVAAGAPAIRLAIDARDPALGSEGYRLRVDASGISIVGGGQAGLFYGVQTLEQLFPAPPSKALDIPYVQVADAPQFAWRGLLLDVSRHFRSVDFVKRLIDAAAAYKLNTLQWHLVDDPGWRLEIKRYPRLTQYGSCGDYDHALGTAPCRYYTQDQIRDVVAYAKQRYVNIVPEIEMPGHSGAAIASYPQLRCNRGVSNVFCPSEQSFTFLKNVLDETMALFPSRYIHTGGDEVPREARAFHDWFGPRIAAYLRAHGRRMIVWDEALAGDLDPDTIVMDWRGSNGGMLAAARGNDTILGTSVWLYFNAYQGSPAWEPRGTNNVDSLHDVYAYGPDLRSLTPAQRAHVLGVQGSLWGEFVTSDALAWWRLFPRTLALSEMAWSSPAVKDWDSFELRSAAQYPRLEARGIPFYIPAPLGLRDTVTRASRLDVVLTSTVPGAAMYYTLDGSLPTPQSARYVQPLRIELQPGEEVRVRVLTVLADGRRSAPAEATFTRSEASAAMQRQFRPANGFPENDRSSH